MDKRGSLRVNDHLQVEGYPNILAMGDVMVHTRSGEVKLGHTAELNAHLAACNVLRMCSKQCGEMRGQETSSKQCGEISGQETSHLLRYPDDLVHNTVSPRIFAISLGKADGCIIFNQLVVNGAFGLAAAMKLLVERTKMRAVREETVGVVFWECADIISAALSKFAFRPDPQLLATAAAQR
jgi:NADH dehydrogenase FAD-containing subunit